MNELCSKCGTQPRADGQRWCRSCRTGSQTARRQKLPKSVSISVLRPDPQNANKGTAKGKKMLRASLEEFGAARSVVVDENYVLIGGNQTVEQAAQIGIQKVRIIDSDGSELIAVRRTDLNINDPKAKKLAIADNRTAEVSLSWDKGILGKHAAEFSLEPFFAPINFAVKDPLGEVKTEGKCSVIITCEDPDEQERLYHKLKADGLNVRRETKK